MENFNNVPSSGTFGSVVSVVNQNFALAKEAIDKLAFSKSACMGFYETSSELNDAHPTPTDGDWALVGDSSPFNVYVANDGSWVDSGVNYNVSVDNSIEINGLGGYVVLDSVQELPASPSNPNLGYLIGTHLYVYVGTGGDTADGKYQDCGEFRGPKGNNGESIESIEKTSTSGLVDTYTITYTDGSTSTFTVTNGADGHDGVSLGEVAIVNNLSEGGSDKVLSAEMGKVLGNALKTNGTLMSIRAYSQEQFDALEELEDNTIYLIGITIASQYSITNNLTNCTTDNPVDSIYEGSSYIAEITADLGFVLDSVSVVMGGVDVTNDVYSDGEINIPNVTGNIVITIAAAESNLPVMNGLCVWLDATDNQNTGTFVPSATTWVSKVACGSFGNISFALIGNVSYGTNCLQIRNDTNTGAAAVYGNYPFLPDGVGNVTTGDFSLEIVLDSQFSRLDDSKGDSIFLIGGNNSNYSGTIAGRWRFGLYDKTTKNLDLWCNDGSGKFATANYSPQSGKQTLTVVRKDGIITYYRNGLQVGSANSNQILTSDTRTVLSIGSQLNSGTNSFWNGFIGDIYDVKIYPRALTAEEVFYNHTFNNNHYNLGL